MGLLNWLSTRLAHNSPKPSPRGNDSPDAGASLSLEVNRYFTDFLPGFLGQALVPGLAGIGARIRFTSGQPERWVSWDVTLESGCISSIQPMQGGTPDIEYQVSDEIFLLVTGGKLNAERAFLSRKVKIRGSLLKGLKMASLLQSFFDRFPYASDAGLPIESDSIDGGDPVRDLAETSLPSVDSTVGDDDLCEELLNLTQGDSTIDLHLTYPFQGACSWQVLMAPPHPFLGATADNEVLRFLARYLALRQCFVIRFGYSFGTAAGSAPSNAIQTFWDTSDTVNDLGLQDLLRVWDWLNDQPICPDAGVALMGYSYGAQLVLKSLSRIHPERGILVSPVVSQLGEEVRQVSSQLLLVTADEDFASTREESLRLSESFSMKPVWVPLPEADHFYRGKMDLLANAIGKYLDLSPKGFHEC